MFQRLNRAEYARAVRDLLAVTVDAGSWLPLDSMSANFDNIADEQGLSATLLEAYLNAAGDISRMAVGDRKAPPIDRTYTNTSYMSQHPWDQLEGAPARHARRHGRRSRVPGRRRIRLRRERHLGRQHAARRHRHLDRRRARRAHPVRKRPAARRGRPRRDADSHRAGLHQGRPAQGGRDVRAPLRRSVRRSDPPARLVLRGRRFGRHRHHDAAAPARPARRRDRTETTGLSETPSRKKIFSCRPTGAAEERPCARTIVTRLGGEAYRRPLTREGNRRDHAVLRRRRGQGRLRRRRDDGGRSASCRARTSSSGSSASRPPSSPAPSTG